MDKTNVRDRFLEEYGGDTVGVRTFFAPLRVNLIGEYTDIAGGLVLPCALDVGIFAAARKRDDGIVRLATTNSDLRVSVDIRGGLMYDKADGWANYPKGVLDELLKAGHSIGGADIFYAGNAEGLVASGLSSSAAIEALTAVVFRELYGLQMDGVSTALLCQRAENRFVGVMCGIMDQFAVCLGKAGSAILLNCGTLEYKYIPARFEERGLKLIIMNTNKKRGLLDSKYNERRAEADLALSAFIGGGILPANGYLCMLDSKTFDQNSSLIANCESKRRAKHLTGENERVRLAAEALERGDFAAFGSILNRAHESVRYDFEVTGPELDAIQEAAVSFGEGCLGARMTGAGFGGCALAIVEENAVEAFIAHVSERYTAATGLEGGFYVCSAGEGAREV